MSGAAAANLLAFDEQDALREVVNIAMGQAAAKLAQVLDVFVALSVPRVRIVELTELNHMIADHAGTEQDVIAVRQAFYTEPCGEIILIFDRERCRSIAGLLGYGEPGDGFVEHEPLLDVSNLLAGACMNGIARQLGAELSFSAPSLMSGGAGIGCQLDLDGAEWSHVLLMEIHFEIESTGLGCHLIILTPEESIAMIRRELSRMLQSL